MGVRNYLVEGVSGTGKTSVATELERRGYHVLHGDRVLAYRGDPQTGRVVAQADPEDVGFGHRHHIWDVALVTSLLRDPQHGVSFFCGGSRNFGQFIGLFDGVFVLEVDPGTLKRRLERRAVDEFGGKPAEREFVLRLQATREDLPPIATRIDATQPLGAVVDAILSRCDLAL